MAVGRLSHALIFHGPEGVGKEMLAGALARTLVCPSPRSVEPGEVPGIGEWTGLLQDACGECPDCVRSKAGTHPDVHLIHRQLKQLHPDAAVRARKGLTLSIDVIREFVIQPAGLRPMAGRMKVFIIREAELLAAPAQNALLKTLEEPPPATCIILLTHALDRLFPTIRSRCQPVGFRLLPHEFVAAKLQDLQPDLTPARAAALAQFAQGSLAHAVQYAEDGLDAFNSRLIAVVRSLVPARALAVAKHIADEARGLGERYVERDGEITETEAQRRAIKALLLLLAAWYRDIMLTHLGAVDGLANADSLEALQQAAAAIPLERAADAVQHITTAERQLDLNANVQLILDTLAINLARLSRAA